MNINKNIKNGCSFLSPRTKHFNFSSDITYLFLLFAAGPDLKSFIYIYISLQDGQRNVADGGPERAAEGAEGAFRGGIGRLHTAKERAKDRSNGEDMGGWMMTAIGGGGYGALLMVNT